MAYKEFQYIKEDGQFIWREGEERLCTHDTLFFFIDTEPPILLSHGSKEAIGKKYDDYVEKMKVAGYDDMAREVMMIDVSKLDIEEINKCINNSGYINKFIKAIKDGHEF